MSDATTRTQQRLLADDARTDLRDRWLAIEEAFVDDPGEAVRRADELVDHAIERVRDSLAARQHDLKGRWGGLDDATTEQLRSALHQYEQLLAQLGDMTAPAGWHDQHGSQPTAHGRSTFERTTTDQSATHEEHQP